MAGRRLRRHVRGAGAVHLRLGADVRRGFRHARRRHQPDHGTRDREDRIIYEYRAKVVSIHDGDTGRFDIDLGFGIWTANQSLRFAGIDAPELGTAAGRAARDYVRGLLPAGRGVVIRTYRDADDKYGRLLADIYLSHDDAFHAVTVNGAIILAGHAKPYDGGAR